MGETDHQPRLDVWDKRSDLVLWEDMEGADSLSLIEDLSQLSNSTSSGVFPQQHVCERDPVFPVSSGMDRERPWLKRRPDFPALA